MTKGVLLALTLVCGSFSQTFAVSVPVAYRQSEEIQTVLSPTNTAGVLRHWRKSSTNHHQRAWDYWNDSGRLRLWFFNPNGAGAFFAELSLFFLCLSLWFFRKPFFRCFGFFGAFALFLLMCLTESRGALVSWTASAILLLVYMIRKRVDRRWLIFFFAAVFALGLALCILPWGNPILGRLISLDAGNLQRLRAWAASPAMLAAAPGGWGEFCGHAYQDWFQAFEDRHNLAYLVNTHLTWMVSNGWIFSVAYVFCWIFAMVFLFCGKENIWCRTAFVLWVSFVILNWFSTLGMFVSLWMLPCALLAVALLTEGKSFLRSGNLVRVLAIAGVGSLLTVGAFLGIGKCQLASRIPLRYGNDVLHAGSGCPVVHLVADKWVLSHFVHGSFGRDVREWCQKHPGTGTLVVHSRIGTLPPKVDRLVLSGIHALEYVRKAASKRDREGLCLAKSMAFISPPFKSSLLKDKFYLTRNANVYTGQHLAALTGDLGTAGKPFLHVVPGTQFYLPQWMDYAFGGVGL